jgi:transcriptional regulator with XRE-family HTH domain
MHMKLEIGTNIRRLRREKNLTQEELAEIFGVSAQSVSRWESNACYPDLELLPTMADFFGTTVDRLLGVDEALEQTQVQAYQDRFQEAVSRGDVETCIAVAREGVASYPNNFFLLNMLMYTLFLAGDEDGNIPEWRENMLKYDKEITALGQRILKHCPDQDIRQEAAARLAFNHWLMGRPTEARQVCQQLPSQRFCRENQIWRYVEESEQLAAVQNLIRGGYGNLSAGLYQIMDSRLLPDQDLVMVFETQQALQNLMIQEPVPDQAYGNAQLRCRLAAAYVRMNQPENALEQLHRTADLALAWDDRPESGDYHSLLLGDYHWDRKEFHRSDDRPCREILRDKWLKHPDFDPLRDRPEFQALLQRLR